MKDTQKSFIWTILAIIIASCCGCSKNINLSKFPAICNQHIDFEWDQSKCTLDGKKLVMFSCVECPNTRFMTNETDEITRIIVYKLDEFAFKEWEKKLRNFYHTEPKSNTDGPGIVVQTWYSKDLVSILTKNDTQDERGDFLQVIHYE